MIYFLYFFYSTIFLDKITESIALEKLTFSRSLVKVTFFTYTPPPPFDGSVHTIITKKSLVYSEFLQFEIHPEIKKEELSQVFQKIFIT